MTSAHSFQMTFQGEWTYFPELVTKATHMTYRVRGYSEEAAHEMGERAVRKGIVRWA